MGVCKPIWISCSSVLVVVWLCDCYGTQIWCETARTSVGSEDLHMVVVTCKHSSACLYIGCFNVFALGTLMLLSQQ